MYRGERFNSISHLVGAAAALAGAACLVVVAAVLPPVFSDCVPTGPEEVDNSVDEDCDGWLGTSHAFELRSAHPRVLMTPELLKETINRMTGPGAAFIARLSDEQRDLMLGQIPLGRLGAPEEIAALVCFLCSDAAAYITGETVHVNGGMHMV